MVFREITTSVNGHFIFTRRFATLAHYVWHLYFSLTLFSLHSLTSLEAFLCTFILPSLFTAPLMPYAFFLPWFFMHQCIHSASCSLLTLHQSYTQPNTHSYNFMWGCENNVYIMHSLKPGTHLCRIPLCNEYLATSCSKLDGEKKTEFFCHWKPLRMIKVRKKKVIFLCSSKIYSGCSHSAAHLC